MANSEHVERLKRSIEEWNIWREEHSIMIPPDLIDADLSYAHISRTLLNRADLSGADLSYANLSNARLSVADLSNAKLEGADLIGARLSGADLSYADLNHAEMGIAHLSNADLNHANLNGAHLAFIDFDGAHLSNADLSHTDLIYAHLSGANLSHANLSSANLSHADLSYANLTGAIPTGVILSHANLSSTIFAKVDLRSVKGLVEIKHSGSSIIDLHSIQLPEDGSALHFLRGVGIPDEWIDFYRATMMHPIQYYSCFLSYSSADDLIVKHLHADLQANGVRCWFALHDLKPGNYVRKEIDQAIHLQDKLLLILSKSAVNSGWVSHEVELALAREMRQQREILFPIRLDNEVLQSTSHWATTLQATRQIGDFTNWTDPQTYQQAFDRLLRDLKKVNQ